jgi:hypothetical protein
MVKVSMCDICYGEGVLSLTFARFGFPDIRLEFCKTHLQEAKKVAAKGKKEYLQWLVDKTQSAKNSSPTQQEISKWKYKGFNE